MARGFLGGILIGGIFSLILAGIVSFVVPMGPPPQMDDTAPQDMAGTDTAISPPTQPVAEDAQPIVEVVPLIVQPESEADTVIAQDTVSAPPPAPEIAQTVELAQPADVAEPAAPAMTSDAPILPNPMALAPMEPVAPDEVAIATDTAEPAPPTAEPTPPVVQPAPMVDDASDDRPTVPEPAADVADVIPQPPKSPQAPEADQTIALNMTQPAPEGPQNNAEGRPTIGVPAAITSERETGVTINRLPTALSSEQPQDSVASDTFPPAITRFAQPFANPDDKPLMSILLIDAGSDLEGGQVGIAALRSFPYPISVAVDVSLDDAAERMMLYRDEGFEVLAMVDLPSGAQPSDAETSFAVAFNKMPEIVGVLEGQGAGLQSDRAVADQVTAILQQGGYGLVTQDKGLNTMPKLAVKEGVPAASIFRDFDSKDQTPTVIRRFLDQAAFKAGVEGSVIMLGRMRPETISALLVWGLQDRASQVALAPISAVLLDQTGG